MDQVRTGLRQEAPEVAPPAAGRGGRCGDSGSRWVKLFTTSRTRAPPSTISSASPSSRARIGDAGVDRHLPPRRLAQGEPAGVDLGAGVVPRRPAVHEVDDPPRSAGRRRAAGAPARAPQLGEHPLARRRQRVLAQEARRSSAGTRGGAAAWRGGPTRTRAEREEPKLRWPSWKMKVASSSDVEEPRLQGAEAELALLAVAEAEALLVEQPQPVERLPLDVEADADAGGQARMLARPRPARRARRSASASSRRAGR